MPKFDFLSGYCGSRFVFIHLYFPLKSFCSRSLFRRVHGEVLVHHKSICPSCKTDKFSLQSFILVLILITTYCIIKSLTAKSEGYFFFRELIQNKKSKSQGMLKDVLA